MKNEIKDKMKDESKNKMKNKKIFTVKDMALISIFAAFITVCSFIQIPAAPVPFTLQTFGIFVTAGVLGARKGTTSIVVYILLGVLGLPVFRGTGGIGVLLGPTGGFIFGFIFAGIIIGLAQEIPKKRGKKVSNIILMIAMAVGNMVCVVIGTIQFMIVTKTHWTAAVTYCIVPFIIPDIVKILLAIPVVNKIRRAYWR